MPMPVAVNYPQLASVGSPEIWSTKILTKFYAQSVIPQVSNTDYEGEIKKFGCKVKIRTTPDVTVSEYSKGQTLTIQNLLPTVVDLDIDKGLWWYVGIDDVDRFQGDIDYMEDWTGDAAQQQKIKLDTLVLAAIYADAHASNKGSGAGVISQDINLGVAGTPLAFTAAEALNILIDLGTVFDEQNVPEDDRAVILPAWACGRIKKSDIKNASITGDGKSTLRSGRIGEIDRLTIYSSNLLAKSQADNAFHAIGIQKKALCFASQFVENQVFDKLEQRFGRAARGLQVYGYKVLKSEALIDLYIKK